MFYIFLKFQFKKFNSSLQIIACLIVLNIVACKKNTPSPQPPNPLIISDSAFQIVTTTKIDINDFDVSYQVNPPKGESFSDLTLQVSTYENFNSTDSILLLKSVTSMTDAKYSLKRLKQSTTYFVRLSIVHANKTYFSAIKEFKTDSLKFLKTPSYINRNVWGEVVTNFNKTFSFNDTSTRIYLDNILCIVPSTNGEITQFIPPFNLLSKKYSLKFERNGISIESKDSIELLFGKWSEIAPPDIPSEVGSGENALGFYGSCYSSEKGYIIPGEYFKMILSPSNPNFGRPSFILEFDGTNNTWKKRIPNNPMYFINPICHYANNRIYVIAGSTTTIHNYGAQINQRMYKFDLATSTWLTLDSLPYQNIFSMVSVEFNNEFYIGMGSDNNNLNPRDAAPLQSKRFWKYNPNTNSWSRLPDFPSTHVFNQNNPTAFVIGSKAYIFYGAIPIDDYWTNTNFKKELWEFDLIRNVWTQLSLPETGGPPIGEKYQILTYNNKAYFITCQTRALFGLGYGYVLNTPCLQFDPQNGSFKKISISNNLDIMKLVFRKGNKFFLQSDALGYTENIPNKTHVLTLE